jgi:hypothetical protein
MYERTFVPVFKMNDFRKKAAAARSRCFNQPYRTAKNQQRTFWTGEKDRACLSKSRPASFLSSELRVASSELGVAPFAPFVNRQSAPHFLS